MILKTINYLILLQIHTINNNCLMVFIIMTVITIDIMNNIISKHQSELIYLTHSLFDDLVRFPHSLCRGRDHRAEVHRDTTYLMYFDVSYFFLLISLSLYIISYHIYIYICMCVYIYIYIFISISLSLYIYIYIYIHMLIFVLCYISFVHVSWPTPWARGAQRHDGSHVFCCYFSSLSFVSSFILLLLYIYIYIYIHTL